MTHNPGEAHKFDFDAIQRLCQRSSKARELWAACKARTQESSEPWAFAQVEAPLGIFKQYVASAQRIRTLTGETSSTQGGEGKMDQPTDRGRSAQQGPGRGGQGSSNPGDMQFHRYEQTIMGRWAVPDRYPLSDNLRWRFYMVLCVIPLSQDRRRRWAAPYVYLNTLLDPASYAYVFDQPCRTAGPNAATGKRTLVPSNGLLTSSFSCGHTCCIERKYPVVIVASRCDISMSETGGCVCKT